MGDFLLLHWQISSGSELQGSLWGAVFVNVLLFGLAIKAKALNLQGALVMGVMGFWIYLALGWKGYLIPVIFFALGSLFTHLGYEKKRNRQVAQKRGGVRGVREVMANGLVPLALTFPIILLDSRLFTLGYVGAWATALCDTSSTELGGLWGRRNLLIKNLRRVTPGTEGAISLEGTVAGFVVSSFLISAACGMKLVRLKMVLPLCLAALLGSLGESYLAEIMPPNFRIKHELLNLFNSSVGGGLALLWGILMANPG